MVTSTGRGHEVSGGDEGSETGKEDDVEKQVEHVDDDAVAHPLHAQEGGTHRVREALDAIVAYHHLQPSDVIAF